MKTPLSTGKTIGIIGGGQLGRMLALAAAKLGFKITILEPQENCPAAQLATTHIKTAYNDPEGLEKLASMADIITYEFENIDVTAAQELSKKTPLFPPCDALTISQDRLLEKDFLNNIGLRTAPYFDISNAKQLAETLSKNSGRGIIKTRRFGYDGKGQIRFFGNVNDPTPEQAIADLAGAPAILEGFVDFTCEISVIATRSYDGTIECFEPAQNIHKNGILFSSTVPSATSSSVNQTAINATKKLIEKLGYIGTLGLEFFVMQDESLIANEFAPRVHNSGHWTEAACAVSQFEQHIRAIVGWPLASQHRHSDCVMENLLGNDIDQLLPLAADPSIVLHAYGKAEANKGRKMGHFTRLYEKKAL